MHQTRTPLTILKSHVEAVEDGLIEVDAKEIDILKDQIDNITAIISNISGMIDANRETDEITIEAFELNQRLRQIIAGLKAQFDNKKIDLILLSNQRLKLKTDKYKLSQVIYNLLTNAYKYSHEDSHVQVSYEMKDQEVILQVKDMGIGIEASELEQIFEAYYRSNSVADTIGEGIGLYVARENLKQIKGSISVRSEKGQGSLFTVRLAAEL